MICDMIYVEPNTLTARVAVVCLHLIAVDSEEEAFEPTFLATSDEAFIFFICFLGWRVEGEGGG